MRLHKLTLNNFQGIKSAEYDFGGHSASIYGQNASGKTTVFNALTWILFDKASTGAKNYTPKTRTADGEAHYLDHSVEASFQLDDGRIMTFRKVYHEIYKKTRGSATEEFSGHTTDYYIDGVPSKEAEFASAITQGVDAERLKILTMPTYFSESISWDARRRILLDMCGDITDADVIMNDPNLNDLNTYLLIPGTTDRFYTVDDYRKIAAARGSEINKKLQDIPGRIDEASRAIPDLSGLSQAKITTDITEKQAAIERLKNEARNPSDDLEIQIYQNNIAKLQLQMTEAKTAHLEKNNTLRSALNNQYQNALAEKNEIQSDLNMLSMIIKDKSKELTLMEVSRQKLIDDYAFEQKKTWDTTKEMCPTCRQDLPADQIENLRAEFNKTKSEKLEKINARGQVECSKEMIDKLKREIMSSEEKQDQKEAQFKLVSEKIDTLKLQIDELSEQTAFEKTPEYERINNELTKYENWNNEHESHLDKFISEKADEIKAIECEITDLQKQFAQFALAESQRNRIDDLKAQEKALAAEYEEIKRGMYLCELFIKAKVNLLTDRINSKFGRVYFRLFIDQINGGVKEDCEVMIPTDVGDLVPFSFANNAARINAGIEIISALSQHWGVSMPIMVDNAESITNLMIIDTQIVRLVVPPPYELVEEPPVDDGPGYDEEYERWLKRKVLYEDRNKKLRLEIE